MVWLSVGRVVEFDRPVTLLARSDSLFTKLVDQAHASKTGNKSRGGASGALPSSSSSLSIST
jgi:hypothetical protein